MKRPAAAAGWAIILGFMVDRAEEIGIGPDEIAERTGLPADHVAAILSAEAIPDAIALVQVLGALGLNPRIVPREADDLPYPRIPDPEPN